MALAPFFPKKNGVQPLASNLMGLVTRFRVLSHWKCSEIKTRSSLPLSSWINQQAWGVLCVFLARQPFHFKTLVCVPPSARNVQAYQSILTLWGQNKIIGSVNEFHFKWNTPVSFLLQNTTLHVGSGETPSLQSFQPKSYFFLSYYGGILKKKQPCLTDWWRWLFLFTARFLFFASVIY